MKSIMISIKPKFCELIANGKKTIEVRKTKPNIELPFKCYIYCTIGDNPLIPPHLNDSHYRIHKQIGKKKWKGKYDGGTDYKGFLNGKIIGEFVCDAIVLDKTFGHDDLLYIAACLDVAERAAYCTNETMYGWHISHLKIYDDPKELGEFKKYNRDCWYADLGLAKRDCFECQNKECFLQRPPQSWCYVEEQEGY